MNATFDSAKVKDLIEKNGYRTDFVAKNIGIKPDSLRQLLRGTYRPSPAVIKLISIFFKLPESEFFKQAA